jgi:hypothetical protein
LEFVGNLIRSAPAFHEETTLPFRMSKDSNHLVFRVCSLPVYLNEEILGYIISTSLIGRGSFGIYKLIPKPLALNYVKTYMLKQKKKILIDRLG